MNKNTLQIQKCIKKSLKFSPFFCFKYGKCCYGFLRADGFSYLSQRNFRHHSPPYFTTYYHAKFFSLSFIFCFFIIIYNLKFFLIYASRVCAFCYELIHENEAKCDIWENEIYYNFNFNCVIFQMLNFSTVIYEGNFCSLR